MSVQEVVDELDRIRACAGDSEAAHSYEDALHWAVLNSIADGSAEDPVAMARLAVTSSAIEFERWMA